MTRIVLAIATALFATATLFTGTAEACISCEYTPQVVNTPNPNAKRKPKSSQGVRAQQMAPAAAKAAKLRQQAKAKAEARARAEARAKAAAARHKAAVAKAEPAADEVAKAKPESEGTETGPRLTGSSALMQQSIPQEKDEPVAAADAEHACKKFVPAVGATVSVPCE